MTIPGVTPGTAAFPGGDPCAREAAWLRTTNDSRPVLPAPAGPWQIIQAYWPGARLDVNQTGVYVCWGEDIDRRSAGIRIMPRYSFVLKMVWPVRNVTGSAGKGLAETEQLNMRAAANLLIQRVRGFVRDKSHGARFLSVGETPSGQPPRVVYMDAEVTIREMRSLRATVSYVADDFEVNG